MSHQYQIQTLEKLYKDLKLAIDLLRPHAGTDPLIPNQGDISDAFRILAGSITSIEISLWKDLIIDSKLPIPNFWNTPTGTIHQTSAELPFLRPPDCS